MKIIQTDKITIHDVKKWVNKCNSLHSLQSIRAKTNKRIKRITQREEYNPMSIYPTWLKRLVLQPLFYEPKLIEYQK